jgi:hypothetical protein
MISQGRNQHETGSLLPVQAGFLIGLLFNPVDGGGIVTRNVG